MRVRGSSALAVQHDNLSRALSLHLDSPPASERKTHTLSTNTNTNIDTNTNKLASPVDALGMYKRETINCAIPTDVHM